MEIKIELIETKNGFDSKVTIPINLRVVDVIQILEKATDSVQQGVIKALEADDFIYENREETFKRIEKLTMQDLYKSTAL